MRIPFNGLGVDALLFELVSVPVVSGARARSLIRVAAVLLLPAIPAASQNTKRGRIDMLMEAYDECGRFQHRSDGIIGQCIAPTSGSWNSSGLPNSSDGNGSDGVDRQSSSLAMVAGMADVCQVAAMALTGIVTGRADGPIVLITDGRAWLETGFGHRSLALVSAQT